MIGAVARHRVQVLRAAGKTLKQVVAATRVSQSSVQGIEREGPIEAPGDVAAVAIVPSIPRRRGDRGAPCGGT